MHKKHQLSLLLLVLKSNKTQTTSYLAKHRLISKIWMQPKQKWIILLKINYIRINTWLNQSVLKISKDWNKYKMKEIKYEVSNRLKKESKKKKLSNSIKQWKKNNNNENWKTNGYCKNKGKRKITKIVGLLIKQELKNIWIWLKAR